MSIYSSDFKPAGITEATEYGTNEIGTPRRTEGGGWERIDLYHGQAGAVTPERRFAAGKDDHSPMARTVYAGKGNCHYHPRCCAAGLASVTRWRYTSGKRSDHGIDGMD